MLTSEATVTENWVYSGRMSSSDKPKDRGRERASRGSSPHASRQPQDLESPPASTSTSAAPTPSATSTSSAVVGAVGALAGSKLSVSVERQGAHARAPAAAGDKHSEQKQRLLGAGAGVGQGELSGLEDAAVERGAWLGSESAEELRRAREAQAEEDWEEQCARRGAHAPSHTRVRRRSLVEDRSYQTDDALQVLRMSYFASRRALEIRYRLLVLLTGGVWWLLSRWFQKTFVQLRYARVDSAAEAEFVMFEAAHDGFDFVRSDPIAMLSFPSSSSSSPPTCTHVRLLYCCGCCVCGLLYCCGCCVCLRRFGWRRCARPPLSTRRATTRVASVCCPPSAPRCGRRRSSSTPRSRSPTRRRGGECRSLAEWSFSATRVSCTPPKPTASSASAPWPQRGRKCSLSASVRACLQQNT